MKNFLKVFGGLSIIGIIALIVMLNTSNTFGSVRETNTFKVDSEGSVLVSDKRLLSNPSITSVSTTTAGTLALDEYFFVLTSLDANGNETSRSPMVSQTVSNTTDDGLVIAFTENSLAASHRVWYSTNGNTFSYYRTATSSTFIASTTVGWTEGTLPTENNAFTDVNDLGFVDAYIYVATTTAGTQIIKTSKGVLHAVTINTDAAGAVVIYDNTTCTGTKIATLESGIPHGTYFYDARFNTGLCITTAAATDLTLMYR